MSGMLTMADLTKEQQEDRDRMRRARQATEDFLQVAVRMSEAGAFLEKKPGGGYLVGVRDQWEMHVYPGSQRFYRGTAKAPRLVVPSSRPWNLWDVLAAVAATIQEQGRTGSEVAS